MAITTSAGLSKTSSFVASLITEEAIKIRAFKNSLAPSIDNQTTNEDPKISEPSAAATLNSINLNKTAEIENLGNLTKLPNMSESFSREEHSNTINDGLDREELIKSSILDKISQTTLKPIEISETTLLPFNKEDSTILVANKFENARSMPRETEDEELKEKLEINKLKESTTKQSNNNENEIATISTAKSNLHVNDSTKESKEENTEEPFIENMKANNNGTSKVSEKKAKFINDNSTNVQYLNLPNNAESWNLASMKPLFPANVTMDTAHKQHNISNEIKEANLEKNNTFSLNSLSTKNLLDWSKVMTDKALYTTIRNQNIQELEKEQETAGNSLTNEENIFSTTDKEFERQKYQEVPELTTTPAQQTSSQPSVQTMEDMAKIKSFIEQDSTNPTITPNSTTILSHSLDNGNNNNNDNNKEDKHANSMNNHIENEITTTKSQSQVNNNDSSSNPSLNIEANLSETNLTSNHTSQQNENEEHNTTTTGKQNLNEDATVDTGKANERVTATATEATAGVVDDMTTTLDHNSIELTTLSTLETSKENASQSNGAVTQQQNNNNNNNEISEDSEQNELENKTVKQELNNKYENIELESKQIATTTETPITTYRPTDLAITLTASSSVATPAFKQPEVDQIGNNEIQSQPTKNHAEQNQSITAFEGGNNAKSIETHLTELEIETTTLETITTTTTTEIAENNLTTSVENNTSSSKDETIIEQITKLDVTTEATTPNGKDDEIAVAATIGSPVIETKFEKETKEDILTKTETPTTTTADTTTATITPKTPVVVSVTETQGAVANKESSTIETAIQEDKHKIDTQTNQGSANSEESQDSDKETEANNETTTMATHPLNTTTMNKADETLNINLLDDTTTTTTSTTSQPLYTTTTTEILTTTTTSTTTTTTTTTPLPITTKIEEIYKVIHTTTAEAITPTNTSETFTESEELFSSPATRNMIPTTTVNTLTTTKIIETADIGKSLPTLTSIMGGNSGNMYPKNSEVSGETDVNVIIAITVSVIGVVALILLVGFLYLMRKRQKQTYSQRCRPVTLDEYTIDNASVGGSVRKSSIFRSSKRTYGNLAFDDPSLRHNAMGVHELAKFTQEKLRIFEEFRDVPQITSRLDEVPLGCEDKNRYANVLPLTETRVILQRLNDDDTTEYINANYVTGPQDPPKYFIACQAPLDTTVEDFWRMIWEQQSRVIIQATDLIENGVEKCAEYLPPSVTLDNHSTFGDFQITLQNREVKDKYAISTILLKHVVENVTRELTHYWYKWPEVGVPAEEAPIIAMLLEARSSLISYAIEQGNDDKEKSSMATLKSAEEGTVSANGTTYSPSKDSNGSSANGSTSEINGNISMVNIKKTARNQGPLTIHCSPGTGRTGTIIACDIAIRSLETPKRTVDIPQIVFYVRRGRASAVLTKEQYEFIYKVANMYAAKISNPTSYN